MTPEDLDKAAEVVKRHLYHTGEIPLFLVAQKLLDNPNRIGAAFIWTDVTEAIQNQGVNWKWAWFDSYGSLGYGKITEGARNVKEVFKRLAEKPHLNLGDYL